MAGVSAYDVSGVTQEASISTSTSAASTTVLKQGSYVFWAEDADCYVYIGKAGDPAVTVDTGWILYTGSKTLPVALKKGQVIQAITASGTGKMKWISTGLLR